MGPEGQEDEVQIPIPELLEGMVERGASDLHITVGTPRTIRQHGDLVRLDDYPGRACRSSRRSTNVNETVNNR
jgi:Tfp pilus assembly pilus retraction ATPase PilT